MEVIGAAGVATGRAEDDCPHSPGEGELWQESFALCWFDREHGPREVVCMISAGNAPSRALAGKLGFAATRIAELPGTGEAVQLYRRLPRSGFPSGV